MKKLILLSLLATLTACIPELIPPDVSIISPENNEQVDRGEVLEVRVEARDEDGTVESVYVYLDELGVASMSGFPYLSQLETATLDPGMHEIRILARDDDNKETEAFVEFEILSTLARVETGPASTITRDSAIIDGSILDAGGEGIQEAGFYWGIEATNQQTYQKVTAEVEDNLFSATLTELDYPVIYYVAFASNARGTAFGEQQSFNPLAPEDDPPSVTLLTPADGDRLRRGEDLEIQLLIEDDLGAISSVRLFLDTTGLATLGGFPYTYTLNTAALSVGEHLLEVEVMDASDHLVEVEASFYVDPSLPRVQSLEPANISQNSALAGGRVLDNGGGSITASGINWGEGAFDGTGSDKAAQIGENEFSALLEGLGYGTFWYRAWAENASGRTYGEVVSFETLPVVESLEPSNVTQSSAQLGGSFAHAVGNTISSSGINWGTGSFDGGGFDESAQLSQGVFSVVLEGLNYGSYWFRAWAETSSGRSYGEVISFETLPQENVFLDPRDGKRYAWQQIGRQVWMVENLAYLPEDLNNPYNSSVVDPFYYVYGYDSFIRDEAVNHPNYAAYGVLYNYVAASEACPEGWHLPTIEDKEVLLSHIGGASGVQQLVETGGAHWNNNGSATNTTGFSARGAGWGAVDGQNFMELEHLKDDTGWWMQDTCATQAGHGLQFGIEGYSNLDFRDQDCAPFEHAYSVRCVKD